LNKDLTAKNAKATQDPCFLGVLDGSMLSSFYKPLSSKAVTMFLNILIGIAIVVVLLAVFIATRPSTFSVSRSATISATPAAVFAQVNDFHKWDAWSPWAKMDPNAKSTFEGSPSGKGAKFHWDGNKNVGAGNMTITESMPNDHIRIRLEFVRPFAGVNDTLFTFKPIGDKTNVTWTMSGRYNFIMKGMSLFMDCEKMVGPQFEKGLASMEEAAKSGT
jgi:hypothetical protein